VLVAPSGDIFAADGHVGGKVARRTDIRALRIEQSRPSAGSELMDFDLRARVGKKQRVFE